MASFEEGLGRIMFVAGALGREQPFLGPLYKFISFHPDAVRRITPYVKFILGHLSAEIKKQRHYSCSTRIATADCSPRVDAQASATRTGIGGWFSVSDREGKLSPWLSDWFSIEIRKDDFPWIFDKGDRPSLVISTLQALAILVALKLKFGETPDADNKRVLVVPSVTGDRGNGAALNKLMSTRFSSSAVLVELASFMKGRGLRTIVEWDLGNSTEKQTSSQTGSLSFFFFGETHPGFSFRWKNIELHCVHVLRVRFDCAPVGLSSSS